MMSKKKFQSIIVFRLLEFINRIWSIFQQIRKVGYTEVETKDGRILNISDTYKKDVRARYSKLLWDGDV